MDLPRTALVEGDRAELVLACLHDGADAPPDEHVRLALMVEERMLRVEVDAPFHGDPPPPASVGSTPRLWEHEVVEVMLLGDEGRYLEVELGPHGHYLALELAGARQVIRQGMELDYEAQIVGGRWRGAALLPRAWLPPGTDRLNGFAIHGVGPARRFLAWSAPNAVGEAPDFHRLDRFEPWSTARAR